MGEAPHNPLDRLIGYQLRRASNSVLADLGQTLAQLELPPAEASILLLIDANPDITQSEIGRILAIKRANMAPLAAGLIARGLIGRAQADGRSHALRLTRAGAALAREAFRRMEAHETRLFRAFSAAERKHLIALLQAIWDEPP